MKKNKINNKAKYSKKKYAFIIIALIFVAIALVFCYQKMFVKETIESSRDKINDTDVVSLKYFQNGKLVKTVTSRYCPDSSLIYEGVIYENGNKFPGEFKIYGYDDNGVRFIRYYSKTDSNKNGYTINQKKFDQNGKELEISEIEALRLLSGFSNKGDPSLCKK